MNYVSGINTDDICYKSNDSSGERKSEVRDQLQKSEKLQSCMRKSITTNNDVALILIDSKMLKDRLE